MRNLPDACAVHVSRRCAMLAQWLRALGLDCDDALRSNCDRVEMRRHSAQSARAWVLECQRLETRHACQPECAEIRRIVAPTSERVRGECRRRVRRAELRSDACELAALARTELPLQ